MIMCTYGGSACLFPGRAELIPGSAGAVDGVAHEGRLRRLGRHRAACGDGEEEQAYPE